MKIVRMLIERWWLAVLAGVSLGLSVYCFDESVSAASRATAAAAYKPRIERAETTRKAIAALQSERGFAMLSLGSGGAYYADDLSRQFAVTDVALAKAFATASEAQDFSSHRVSARLRELRAKYGVRSGQALAHGVDYSFVVGELLDDIERLTEGGGALGLEVIQSYFLLLHGAERAAKEQVLISLALVDGKVDRNTFAWLGESISYQDSLLNILLAIAPQTLRSVIENKLGRELQLLGETLRREVIEESTSSLDPRSVYQMFEGKSLLLGEVFSHYGEYLGEQVAAVVHKEQNRSRYWFLLSFAPWALLLLIWLGDNLRRSSRRHKELIASIDGVVWEADATTLRVTYVSPKGEEILGFPRAVLLAPGFWREHVHPDDREFVFDATRSGIASGKPYTIEYRLLVEGGRSIWLHDQVNVVIEHGKARWLRGVMVDVSARREAETQARLAAEVLGNMVEGVFVTDSASRIVFANKAFCRISGYSEPELIGRTPKMMKSGRHSPEFYEAMWAALNSQGMWEGEVWNRRKNGEIYPEHIAISAVRGSAGGLTHFIAVTADLSEKKKVAEQIERLERVDALTGLPNWPTLSDELAPVLENVLGSGGSFLLMLIDLDRFRHVVYSIGYEKGDRVLQLVAERVVASSGNAFVSRRGADVFCVAKPIADADEAMHVAEIVRDMVSHSLPPELGELVLSASAGLAIGPQHGSTIPALLGNAELALQTVKDRGRDGFAVFDSVTMDVRDFVILEHDLRRALERGELHLYFQPKVTASEGRIIGAEVLLRWVHPTLGMISPARFIPIAEETGMIVGIGEWIIRESSRLLRKWSDAGFDGLSLAVNISARQFRHKGLLSSIVAALDEFGTVPGLLELELTESLLVDDPGQVATTLMAIKDVGVRLSIDDFGTGYSSLNYLKRYPIDCLKIDQSFVRDLHVDADDAAIVQAVIGLAKSLRMKVVAEGVEHLSQLEFLRSLDCDLIQGYLYSRPIPLDAYEKLLACPVLEPGGR